jgi:hypothetical protein
LLNGLEGSKFFWPVVFLQSRKNHRNLSAFSFIQGASLGKFFSATPKTALKDKELRLERQGKRMTF